MKRFKKSLAVLSAICTTTFLLSSLTVPQAAMMPQTTKDGLEYIRHSYYIEIVGCEDYVSDVVIPEEIDGLPVMAIGNSAFAFRYCSDFSLKSVTLPDTITRIGERAFFGSYYLESIHIPENVQLIEPGFVADCQALKSITVDSNNPYYTSKNGLLFSKDETELVSFPAGLDEVTSYTVEENVTEIKSTAFYGCDTLETINLHDGITQIGDSSFMGCKALKSVDIPDNLTEIPNMAFRDCESLTEITVPDNITKIDDHAFSLCPNLETIHIPDSVTSLGHSVFYECEKLDNVILPDSITSIGNGLFKRCYNLKNVTLPKNITEIPQEMFTSCLSLENIELPKKLKIIRNSAFGCNIKSIVIPEGVTELEYAAFQSCKNLETIEFPESLEIIGNYALGGYYVPTKWYENQPEGYVYAGKNLYEYKGVLPENSELTIDEGTVSISDSAFYGQNGLKSIVLPESVKNIDNTSFLKCENLKSITFLNPECEFIGFECDMDEMIGSETMIYGFTGSTAQAYAEKYDKNFIALDKEPVVTTTPATSITPVTLMTTTTIPHCTCGLNQHTTKSTTTTISTGFMTGIPTTGTTKQTTTAVSTGFDIVTTISDVPIIRETTEIYTTIFKPIWTSIITTTPNQTTTVVTSISDVPIIRPDDTEISPDIKPVLRGDIAENNQIDIYDAIEIAKYLMSTENYNDSIIQRGDYNNDGKTDIYDAVAIAKKLISD